MEARVRLLPAPDGPKSTVTPGGTSNVTSIASPFPLASIASWTESVSVTPLLLRSQLAYGIEENDDESSEDDAHGSGIALAVRLDRVVDREGGRLRVARDVTSDHQRYAEVA